MQNLITSYIIQARECRLRDIGRFKITDISAETDIANKQIIPPAIEIKFTPREEKISDGLVKYVSDKKKISISQAQEDLKNWCAETRAKLKEGAEIILEPLGVLKKGSSGNLFIQNTTPLIFFEPVAAERVIHQNSEHSMLVGDKETTSSKMNNFYQEEEIVQKNNTWKIFAAILFAIALLLLIIHFYGNPFSSSTTGNQNKIIPANPPDTYTIP
jgi:nucleoid DNA-binding protein